MKQLLALACLLPILFARAEDEASKLQSLPGFKIEHLLKADLKTQGSWISMAKDPKGRLLLGGQANQPVTRVTIQDGQVRAAEDIQLGLSETMGLLFVGDYLYINGQRKNGNRSVFGLYRAMYNPQTDKFEPPVLLREWQGGGGEHGAHGIVLGPDKMLYVVIGNFVGIPKDLMPSSPHRNYADDLALPRAEDGNGFGVGKVPPGGSVIRMDLDGKNAELFASGQRNTYDIAFNADGELFGFDSDMEWDWGMPWYRPVRAFHAVSGGDTGFREGTAKWPEYYADSLPASVNIGIGCPTGVLFGTGAKFPAKYQKAFYILDWTYGRLIAVHLKPNGAGYGGTWENLVAPKSLKGPGNKSPLNLTDAVIGDDGAMYFTVGGRGTQAHLYRVTYTGAEPTAAADLHDKEGAEARDLRHKLEAYHSKADTGAVDFAWPHLNSSDRYIRYAARIAIERQPVNEWKSKALAEKQPNAALTALLALARLGKTESQNDLLAALGNLPLSSLSESQQLDKLRVLEVSISRQGKPTDEFAAKLIAELDAAYPAKTEAMNRELSSLMIALDAPNAIPKTMALIAKSATQEEQIGYMLNLRHATNGWTTDLRKQYFGLWVNDQRNKRQPDYVLQWFYDAGRPYSDGSSFPRFLGNFHAEAKATLKPDEKEALAAILDAYVPPGAKPAKKPKPVERKFVKDWQTADLLPLLDQVGKGRNFARGKEVYESDSGKCNACHRFGNDGGMTGPDLTAIATRFQRKDILESLTEPSKVVSEQFANTQIKTNDGKVVVGRIIEESESALIIKPDPLKEDKVTVKKADIAKRELSKVSPMPTSLLNNFTQEEILDLLAYLESQGRKEHPNFSK